MILGIVGAEGSKFSVKGAKLAKELIDEAIEFYRPEGITSGHCHLGGIDIWAEEAAKKFNIFKPELIFAPKSLNWSTGYQPRNIKIAVASTVLINIVVEDYPIIYGGMRFKLCYHCARRNDTIKHVKSGGCWTLWFAKERYKRETTRLIVNNE